VLMYRKLSLSIIDNFAIFGVIKLSGFLRKLSITHDNLIFQYLNFRISTKSKYFFEKFNIKKKKQILCLEPEILEKLFKAMKTVPPTSIKQLSILSIKTIKKLFWVDFLPLSKNFETYTRNYRYR
jgi:hypothetical protein